MHIFKGFKTLYFIHCIWIDHIKVSFVTTNNQCFNIISLGQNHPGHQENRKKLGSLVLQPLQKYTLSSTNLPMGEIKANIANADGHR